MVTPSTFLPSDDHIDFTTSTDTGERNAASAIAPIANGEPANQATFNRPPENLRARTEMLRTSLEDQKYLQDTDVRWIITGVDDTGYAHQYVKDWNKVIDGSPSGKFAVSDDIVLQPVSGIDADAKEVASWVLNDYSHAEATFAFTAALKSYQGGNQLRIVWQAGTAVTATLTGSPQHILTITYLDGVSTVNQIAAAIAVLGVTEIQNDDGLTLWSWTVSGAAGYGSTLVAASMFTTVPTDTNPADYTFTKNREREKHQITPAVLVSFFATAANRLTESGDTLAIYYPYLSDPLAFFADDTDRVGGRRQACTSAPGGTTYVIGVGQLFNSRVEPQKIPLSIPICRRIGDDLFFVDGTLVTAASVLTYNCTYFGENGYTIDTILAREQVVFTEKWANGVTPHSGDPLGVQAALNLLVSSLASDSSGGGTELIGTFSHDTAVSLSADVFHLTAGMFFTELCALIDKLNNKGSLGTAESITGAWHFKNNLVYDADSGTPTYTTRTDEIILKDLDNEHTGWVTTEYGGRQTKFSITEGASTYFTENKVLEGFYAQSTVTENDLTPGINSLKISGGVAIVGGRLINLPTHVVIAPITNDGSDAAGTTANGGGLTQYAFDALTSVANGRWCGFLYVWLRKDGTIWLDTKGVVNLSHGAEYPCWRSQTGNSPRTYGPIYAADSLPQAGFRLGDYCLIDVVWVVQGNASVDGTHQNEGLRIATCPLVGGNRRHFEYVQHIQDGGGHVEVEHLWVYRNLLTASDPAPHVSDIARHSTAGVPGSPGIPHFLTRCARAALACSATGDVSSGIAIFSVCYGDVDGEDFFLNLYAKGASNVRPQAGVGLPTFNLQPLPSVFGQETDLILDGYPDLLTYFLFTATPNATVTATMSVHGRGFYWERNSCYNARDTDADTLVG